GGVALAQHAVELLAVVETLAELGGLGGQLLVREGLHLPLPIADRAREIHDLLEPSTLPCVEDEVECTHCFVKYDANSDRALTPGVGPWRLRCLVSVVSTRSFDVEKAFPDGVDHGLHPGMQVQLLQDIAHMVLD